MIQQHIDTLPMAGETSAVLVGQIHTFAASKWLRIGCYYSVSMILKWFYCKIPIHPPNSMVSHLMIWEELGMISMVSNPPKIIASSHRTPRDHQLRPQGALTLPQLPQLRRLHGDRRERHGGCHRGEGRDGSWRLALRDGQNVLEIDGFLVKKCWMMMGDDWMIFLNMCCTCSAVGEMARVSRFWHGAQSPRDYYWSQTKWTEQPFPRGGFPKLEDLKSSDP